MSTDETLLQTALLPLEQFIHSAKEELYSLRDSNCLKNLLLALENLNTSETDEAPFPLLAKCLKEFAQFEHKPSTTRDHIAERNRLSNDLVKPAAILSMPGDKTKFAGTFLLLKTGLHNIIMTFFQDNLSTCLVL